MSLLTQIGSVTAMNLKSVPSRLGTSSVVVIGIAGVVGVLISVFGMTRSLEGALADTGRADRAIVLRGGATGEGSSTLAVDAVATITDAPGVARTPEGDAAVSAEMLTGVTLPRKQDGTAAAVGVRGVGPQFQGVRPDIRIVEGRVFTPGLREVLVGRGAHAEFEGLAIGDEVALRDSRWRVVGIFESGDSHESGIFADSATLLSAYQRTTVNSMTARLESEAAFDTFKDALTTNPSLSVSVERESDYFKRQSENAGRFLEVVTTFVAGIMSLGALFAALNTMYSAVSSRAMEIATLRAIGFGSTGVVVSVLAEALILAVIGALLGAAAAWLLFGGNTISMGGNLLGSLVFQMRITPALIGFGVLVACVVGLVGGLFPAIRAARLPVAMALRAL